MLKRIQSFSDIVTNSSSEVFVKNYSEELEKYLKAINVHFEYFKTEEDLKKFIFEDVTDGESYSSCNASELYEVLETSNPFSDSYLIEDLLRYHTVDEIWDFFKPLYSSLIGQIFVDVDRDYLYRQERKYKESKKDE